MVGFPASAYAHVLLVIYCAVFVAEAMPTLVVQFTRENATLGVFEGPPLTRSIAAVCLSLCEKTLNGAYCAFPATSIALSGLDGELVWRHIDSRLVRRDKDCKVCMLGAYHTFALCGKLLTLSEIGRSRVHTFPTVFRGHRPF